MASILGKAPTQIVEVPLTSIRVDYDWNARKKSEVLRTVKAQADAENVVGYKPDSETTGLGGQGDKAEPGLIEDIILKGQTDPVDLRPNPDPKTREKQPYLLVAGFKRFTALTQIADQSMGAKVENPIGPWPAWKSSAPVIRAVIHEGMTNAGARLRNIAENTDRDDFEPRDFCYGVMQLMKEAHSEKLPGSGKNGEVTGEDIAVQIGKSRAYVFQALSIMKELPPSVTGHWRNGGKVVLGGIEVSASKGPLPFATMYALAQDYRDDKKKGGKKDPEAMYAEILMNKTAKRGGDQRKKLLEKTRAKCEELARFVGWCHRRGVDMSDNWSPDDWTSLAEMIVNDVSDGDAFVTFKSEKNLTENQRQAIATGMANAYDTEVAYDPNAEEGDEEPEETAEETPAAKKGGKKGKKANGASASTN